MPSLVPPLEPERPRGVPRAGLLHELGTPNPVVRLNPCRQPRLATLGGFCRNQRDSLRGTRLSVLAAGFLIRKPRCNGCTGASRQTMNMLAGSQPPSLSKIMLHCCDMAPAEADAQP